MTRIRPISLPDHTVAKRGIMLLALLLAAAVPFIVLIEPFPYSMMMIVLALLLAGILVYGWAYLDSREVAEQLPPVLGVALILFNFFPLCIYLFHSRGLRYGLRAVGKTLLLLAAMFLVSASIFQVMEIQAW